MSVSVSVSVSVSASVCLLPANKKISLTSLVVIFNLLDFSVATSAEDLDETLLISSSTLDCPEGRREGGREGGRE